MFYSRRREEGRKKKRRKRKRKRKGKGGRKEEESVLLSGQLKDQKYCFSVYYDPIPEEDRQEYSFPE